jgi:hypothetical protein
MQAAALDKLHRDGGFEPVQAVAIAEAIDMAVIEAQFVTVPLLDAQLDARFRAVDARFAHVDVRFAEVKAEFAVLEARIDTKLESLKGIFEQKLAGLTIRLIGAIVVSSIASGPLGEKILSALLGHH